MAQSMPTIALDRTNPDYHCVLGSACLARGRLETATTAYRDALRLRPDEPRAHEALGDILTLQGRPDEAAGCLRRFVSLRPGDAGALAKLATALMALGRLDEVSTACRQAIQTGGESAEAHKRTWGWSRCGRAGLTRRRATFYHVGHGRRPSGGLSGRACLDAAVDDSRLAVVRRAGDAHRRAAIRQRGALGD